MKPRRDISVCARRSEPPNSLDFFPTPPWATRAFAHELQRRGLLSRSHTIFEPACGEGHMAAVLQEFVDLPVFASDIFPYGYGTVNDFLDAGEKHPADWIITNPPFNKAIEFAETAIDHPAARAAIGVAMLVRLSWLEGGEISGRYDFFQRRPPYLVLIHAGRVPMHRGRWEVNGRTATSYCWVIWLQPDRPLGASRPDLQRGPRLGWLAPDIRHRHSRSDDARRFGARSGAPLLDAEVPYGD